MGATYNLSVSMVGGEKLLAALSKGDQLAAQELARALNKAANDVAREVNQYHQRNGGSLHKSGRLLASFTFGNPDSASHMATPDSLKAVVGTNVEYGRAQELGTVGMTIHSHSKRGKQFSYIGNIKPKYYLKQALEAVRANFSTYLETAAQRIITDIAK